MHRRIDLYFGWLWLRSGNPEVEPRFGGGKFEDSDPLHVRHRALAREHLLQGDSIDDPVPRKMAVEQALADLASEMIEQSGRKMARAALNPTVRDQRG